MSREHMESVKRMAQKLNENATGQTRDIYKEALTVCLLAACIESTSGDVEKAKSEFMKRIAAVLPAFDAPSVVNALKATAH